jgi:hypothetical protein
VVIAGNRTVRPGVLASTSGGKFSVPFVHGASADQGIRTPNAMPGFTYPQESPGPLGRRPGLLSFGRPVPRYSVFVDYFGLIVIRLTFSCASADFGRVTVRTPFLNDALTLSSSTSSTGIRRSNRP